MNTGFPQPNDVRQCYALTGDFTRRTFPLVPYKKMLTQPEELDDVHNEIVESAKRWADPIDVRAFAKPDEVTQPLTRFSLENLRACTLMVSVPDLVAAGLASQDPATFAVTLRCGIGDRFTYSQQDFSVLSIVPMSRWANTDIILYMVFTSEIYRASSDGVMQ